MVLRAHGTILTNFENDERFSHILPSMRIAHRFLHAKLIYSYEFYKHGRKLKTNLQTVETPLMNYAFSRNKNTHFVETHGPFQNGVDHLILPFHITFLFHLCCFRRRTLFNLFLTHHFDNCCSTACARVDRSSFCVASLC